jgi:CDP-2,3-bis-(O-geranylgeranyl)-sn-glycerol synthase
MTYIILQAMYFFLPAYLSNMAPVIFSKINPFSQPVDGGKKLGSTRVFGANKTWGGLLIAIITGTLVFYIQQRAGNNTFALLDYTTLPLTFGLLMASGAILGDLAKSFVKRRLHKKSGSQWFPIDQVDYVIGALLFTRFMYTPPANVMITLFILAPFLHYGMNYLAFLLRLKRVKW